MQIFLPDAYNFLAFYCLFLQRAVVLMARLILLVLFSALSYAQHISAGKEYQYCSKGIQPRQFRQCQECCTRKCQKLMLEDENFLRACCPEAYYTCRLAWWAWFLIVLGVLIFIVIVIIVIWCFCCQPPLVPPAAQPQPVLMIYGPGPVQQQ